MGDEAPSITFGVAPSSGTLILRLLDNEPPRLHRVPFGTLTEVSLRAVADRPADSAIVLSDVEDEFDCDPWIAWAFGGRGQRLYLIDRLRESPSVLCVGVTPAV